MAQDEAEMQDDQVTGYVLGTLPEQERADFEQRLARDPSLASQVMLAHAALEAAGDGAKQGIRAKAFEHVKREFWDENRLPWHRRLRIWEFALGGIGAALFAYATVYFS